MDSKLINASIWHDPEFRKLKPKLREMYFRCITVCDNECIVNLDEMMEEFPEITLSSAYDPLIKLKNKGFLERKSGYKFKVLYLGKFWKFRKYPRDRYGKLREEVYRRDNFTCQYCGAEEDLSLDHIIPQSKGGEDKISNLVTACCSCNSKKGARTPEELGMELMNDPREGDHNG
ncbi:HNH endonuclease [Sporohalobacter salinus]|uniref:HNH endonuclease n=1 Tax=Sporohalobacter salinus TaxID=1494606 RepID=UPI0019621AB6|nr:HNH endonuclease [Sporohalobacter salinus]MBM7624761.1 Fe2+ or Zn2+ uptake regulation protein [Sporohalobacter salinus]